MTSLISNLYLSAHLFQKFNNWALERELNLPLEPARNQGEEDDCSLEPTHPMLWERLVFRGCTGLDLKRIRQLKCSLSPRFEELMHKSYNRNDKNHALAHFTTELIRLREMNLSQYLESYWLDRELSIRVQNLEPLHEYLKNHKLTDCEGTNYHPESTGHRLGFEHPIESELASRVWVRLFGAIPLINICIPHLEINYNRETDTFSIVGLDKGIISQNPSYAHGCTDLENCINESLTKRLAQDVINRRTNPQSKLGFVRNEMYEEALKKKRAYVQACWTASIALVVFSTAGIFFYHTIFKNQGQNP